MFALDSYIGIEYASIFDKPVMLSGQKGIALSFPIKTAKGVVVVKATFYLHYNVVTNEEYFVVEVMDKPPFHLLVEDGKVSEGINGEVRTKVDTKRVLSPRNLLKPTAYFRKKYNLPSFCHRQGNRIAFRFHIEEPMKGSIEEIQILCSIVTIGEETYIFLRSHAKTKICLHTGDFPCYLYRRSTKDVVPYSPEL